jgi:hypothetical protein
LVGGTSLITIPALIFALADHGRAGAGLAQRVRGPGLHQLVLQLPDHPLPGFGGPLARLRDCARALGEGRTRIMLLQILPNVVGPILVVVMNTVR